MMTGPEELEMGVEIKGKSDKCLLLFGTCASFPSSFSTPIYVAPFYSSFKGFKRTRIRAGPNSVILFYFFFIFVNNHSSIAADVASFEIF